MTADAAKSGSTDYRFGFFCLVAGASFSSLAGILLRLFDAPDGWQILFYRSLAFLAAMLIFIRWRHGRQSLRAFIDVGRPGLAVAVLLASAFMFFIFSLLNTSVANVVFTISLSPFFAALFAWIVLRETVPAATWVATVVAMAGVALMFGDGLAAGNWLGNLLALACCLCYSGTIVAMRKGRAVDMIPAVFLAGVIAVPVSAVMAPGFAITAHDLLLAVTLGVVQLAFQYMLLTTGTRYVPAVEVALIGRITLVMAPFWVWIGVGEVPSDLTLAGGAVVLAALIGHGIAALRRTRRVIA